MSVDSNLNLVLTNLHVGEEEKHPQLKSSKSCLIRGNVIRYIHFNKNDIDLDLIEEACRKEYDEKKLK